ncbi:MAG: phosphoribosylformylglycinamidine cyclo-ligase [Planctomycetota bacterium]|jgi:phosphoribosylformylglycinamidine cyclo-ligase|nr:phosphoribosylformylglycinamidine cyclo-ligase [Planctomycetota bacterium]
MTAPDARYQARGVSAGKAEVHAAIADQDAGLFPGAFCKILPDLLTADPDACVLMHADGAGTKSSLAYLAWMEGLGESVWAGIAQDSLVMNLDDCGCVGALGPFLISNTIGRNAKRIPGTVIKGIIDGYTRLCDQLNDEGIACHMTGGETADVGDLVRTVIADSTIFARLRRAQVVDAGRMAPGDVIVSFSSTGQARWEDQPNSGMGSNGLTSARHDALGADYRAKYPETYAPETDASLVYCGPHAVADALPGDPAFTVGGALLSPTRTYLPLIKALLDELPVNDVHGLIHCSGGGQAKIGKFGAVRDGRGNRYVKDALLPVPPLFTMLREASGTSWQEAYTVWNMGARLEAIVPADKADICLAVAKDCAIEAVISGRVEQADGPKHEVVISTEQGTFRY